jgi:hypothetical protein
VCRLPKHRKKTAQQGGSLGVLQQVFVLPAAAGPLTVSGISIDFCDENDEQDADFFGAVKVRCGLDTRRLWGSSLSVAAQRHELSGMCIRV